MFTITVPDPEIVEEHYYKLEPLIYKKITDIINKKENIQGEFKEFLLWMIQNNGENLQTILIGTPDQLINMYSTVILRKFNFKIDGENFLDEHGVRKSGAQEDAKKFEEYKKCLKDIFDYGTFSNKKTPEYNAYNLVKNLNLRTCPYCNHQYILTVQRETDGSYLVRPELDHYFSKERFPMFALSFYNLIPSCHVCNSNIKGIKELNPEEYFHPYIQEKKDFHFRITLKDTMQASIDLDFEESGLNKEKAKATCDFFKLKDIYSHHVDEAERLLFLYRTYSPEYIDSIVRDLGNKGISITKEELLKWIYRRYIIEHPDDEVLGKFKDDLFRQIYEYYRKDE